MASQAEKRAVARVRVKVSPGARRSEISWSAGGELAVSVQASAVDGKANAALQNLLADRLGLARSAVSIVHGATARRKLVEIDGLDSQTIRERLGKE